MFGLKKGIKLKKVGNTISDEDIKVIEKHFRDSFSNLEEIGSGCFGTVYKYQSLTGKIFAIKYAEKENHVATTSESHDIDTLLELRDYDYFTKIHAYDDKNISGYFVMVVDFVDGISLCKYYNDFDLNENFYQFYQNALDILVSKNISINDLHGNNIMIDRLKGLPFIVDYGGLYKINKEIDLDVYNGYNYTLRRVKDIFDQFTNWKKSKIA